MTPRIVWEGATPLRKGLVAIDSLEAWPDNPRRGDVAAIGSSLRRFGQLKPVVVQGGRIVAGHHIVLAALEQGWSHVAVVDGDFSTEEEARAFLLADNRTSELGEIDQDALAAQLAALSSYEGTGYSEDEAAAIARLSAVQQFEEEPLLALEADPVSKLGEVYELGPHRLMCGDSTQAATLEALFQGDRASAVWTDPPYGVDYVGKTAKALTIANDSKAGLGALLRAAFGAVDAVLEEGAPFYLAAPAGPRHIEFLTAIAETGWTLHETLIWVKDVMVLGHADYHYRHEPILYGWKPGPGRSGRGNHAGSRWYGDNSQTTVFEVPRPTRSEEHPTMKPVELIERMLVNSTQRGGIVLDPFAGSGSTLIASERLGRRCYLAEIDPRYCDVVRRRYAAFVGDETLAP